MQIKEKIEEIVTKIKTDDKIGQEFKENPVKVIEDLLGVDLPDEQVKLIVEGVKSHLEGAGGGLHNIIESVENSIKKLF